MFKMGCCDKMYSSDSKVNAVKYNVIMINHLSSGTLDSGWGIVVFFAYVLPDLGVKWINRVHIHFLNLPFVNGEKLTN